MAGGSFLTGGSAFFVRSRKREEFNNKEGAFQGFMLSFGKYRYTTACEIYANGESGEHEGYAIIGRQRFKRGVCMLRDVTTSREAADKLVEIVNSNQVDLCHMQDVTEDLLTTLKY